MTIVFDDVAYKIYVEDGVGKLDYMTSIPDNLRPAMYYRLRAMYQLGQQHKSLQIRKALGV